MEQEYYRLQAEVLPHPEGALLRLWQDAELHLVDEVPHVHEWTMPIDTLRALRDVIGRVPVDPIELLSIPVIP